MKGVPSSVTFSVGMTLAEVTNATVVKKIDRWRRRFMVMVAVFCCCLLWVKEESAWASCPAFGPRKRKLKESHNKVDCVVLNNLEQWLPLFQLLGG